MSGFLFVILHLLWHVTYSPSQTTDYYKEYGFLTSWFIILDRVAKTNSLYILHSRSLKRSTTLFQKSLFYFRHGESTSTASQLTSLASQKSKGLNYVPLLLQDLDYISRTTHSVGCTKHFVGRIVHCVGNTTHLVSNTEYDKKHLVNIKFKSVLVFFKVKK